MLKVQVKITVIHVAEFPNNIDYDEEAHNYSSSQAIQFALLSLNSKYNIFRALNYLRMKYRFEKIKLLHCMNLGSTSLII